MIGHFQFRAYEGEVSHSPILLPSGIHGILLPNQSPIWEWEGDNLVVTAGKDLSLDRLFGLSGPPAAVVSVGVGTDSTAAAVGQTQLNPSVAGSVLLQTADAGTSRTAETVTMASTYATGSANFSWNEFGLFNGNTNGTSKMLNRIIIGPFTKTSAVSIIITGTITQS